MSRNHHRKRLLDATLALAQSSHCIGVGCIAGKVEAAETLDGDDVSASQARNGFGYRIGNFKALAF